MELHLVEWVPIRVNELPILANGPTGLRIFIYSRAELQGLLELFTPFVP